MNIKELLKGVKCSCGQVHSCEIKAVVIEAGAVKKVGELSGGYNHILLAADTNTYAVCGDLVKSQLEGRLDDVLVFESEGFLVPNELAIEKLTNKVTDKTDLIIGIGSGVIQDLCKYVSFTEKLPYHIIATAPSMDGYASKGAAMIIGNMKVTYNAHVPEVIIGDTDILKDAPMDMIKSGYGDILGKFSCLNDWKLSHVVNNEYLCDYVYDLTYEMLSKTKDLGPDLLKREETAVKTLMEALIGVGIAMAYVGNSRPASGSEHHLSHFFEVIGIMKNEPYFMHGTDVVFSCVYTQRLREELLLMKEPCVGKKFDKKEWENKIRSVYLDAAEGVIELQNKLGWYEQDKMSVYKAKWEEIKEVLADTPSSCELIGYLKSIDLDIADFEKMYGEEKIQNALWFAKDLKDRYSVLWLYYALCYK
ncbi:MAG: sn-glycerol-1-phosphate dehydrogenase [Clostridia bacterium]|nr:sn-glycerol-1-phosphate dehydrogenase [Clostridia bacterium]